MNATLAREFSIVSVDAQGDGSGRVAFTDGVNIYGGEIDPAVGSPVWDGLEGLSYSEAADVSELISSALDGHLPALALSIESVLPSELTTALDHAGVNLVDIAKSIPAHEASNVEQYPHEHLEEVFSALIQHLTSPR